ncbi:MAG: acyl-CoA thioesterase II [Myxococcota bacterium]|nr:acyl-CoA thioesterase II [Myxococcota bacterium]
MTDTLDDLLQVLDLEEIDFNIFRGTNEPTRYGRLFGGQVAAQALVAAGRTVEGLPAHSLHGYFLRPGDPSVPVVYTVDRIRDGRSFVTRRVVGQQRGKAIFNMATSFHQPEFSYEHQDPMPDAPGPEEVPTWTERMQKVWKTLPEEMKKVTPSPRPIDIRHVQAPTYLGGESSQGSAQVWMKADGRLADDPLLHQCVLTYGTDISLLDNILRPHGRLGKLGPMMVASIDHAVWFHRPLRADEWLLYVQDSPVAFGARGFARGTLYARDGTLIASTSQEGLMRPVKEAEDRTQ